MARKSKTQQLTEGIAGQHLALSVAAHLARTQLVPDPLKVYYDGQHLADTLDVVALALARTATLHVVDPVAGEPRQLTAAELDGAVAKRGATTLVLKDGRSLAGVSIRRSDLRQAIAILKAVGLPEIAPPPAPKAAEPGPGPNVEAVRARFAEVEGLLTPPLVPAQVERAKAGAVWIARHAPHGRIANLAMQLMSALQETRGTEEIPGGFRMALARLRAALQDNQNAETLN